MCESGDKPLSCNYSANLFGRCSIPKGWKTRRRYYAVKSTLCRPTQNPKLYFHPFYRLMFRRGNKNRIKESNTEGNIFQIHSTASGHCGDIKAIYYTFYSYNKTKEIH